MAKQIHVLDQVNDSPGLRRIRVVFWYPIIGTAQVPKPGFVSQAPAANIAPADQSALESGALLEEAWDIPFATSYTTTQMKAEINARYTDRAAAIAALPNARAFYGVFYDPATGGWSA